MKLLSKWEDIDIEEAKDKLYQCDMDEEEIVNLDEDNFYWRTDFLDFNTIEYLKHRKEQIRKVSKDLLLKNEYKIRKTPSLKRYCKHWLSEDRIIIYKFGELAIYENENKLNFIFDDGRKKEINLEQILNMAKAELIRINKYQVENKIITEKKAVDKIKEYEKIIEPIKKEYEKQIRGIYGF